MTPPTTPECGAAGRAAPAVMAGRVAPPAAARLVHAVLPAGIDDANRPSGGNGYDRRVLAGLAGHGWQVREQHLDGGWPRPDAQALRRLAATLAAVPDGAVVLADGLVASGAAPVLVDAAARLRLAVLVHMPFGPTGQVAPADERRVFAAARTVVTTSRWTRDWLVEEYRLAADRIRVAEPGVDVLVPVAGPLAGSGGGAPAGTRDGRRLLCVAAVTPHKGQDVLLSALAGLGDLPWRVTFVGALDRDPDFVRRLRRRVDADGFADRVRFAGVYTGLRLSAAYGRADLLVAPSRTETYGMVVTEALACGLPAVATAVGGLPEALGFGAAGRRPGLLVPAGDPEALAAALRDWLTDAALRARLRRAVAERRLTLRGWPVTAARVGAALADTARDAAEAVDPVLTSELADGGGR